MECCDRGRVGVWPAILTTGCGSWRGQPGGRQATALDLPAMPARAPLTRVPWQDWPLWKQEFLVLVIAGVAYALLKAAVELWRAGERILAAFATLLGVLVQTLPSVMIAGVVALAGLWVLNNVDLSTLPVPSFLQTTSLQR
jgi:hypothetical protein